MIVASTADVPIEYQRPRRRGRRWLVHNIPEYSKALAGLFVRTTVDGCTVDESELRITSGAVVLSDYMVILWTNALLAPHRLMDDNMGLSEGISNIDIYYHRRYKSQWKQKADDQGLTSSRYLVELIQERHWQHLNNT